MESTEKGARQPFSVYLHTCLEACDHPEDPFLLVSDLAQRSFCGCFYLPAKGTKKNEFRDMEGWSIGWIIKYCNLTVRLG